MQNWYAFSQRFYRRYLRNYWLGQILKAVFNAVHISILWTRRSWRRFYFSWVRPDPRICHLVSIEDFAASRKLRVWRAIAGRNFSVTAPEVFPIHRTNALRLENQLTEVPPASIYTVPDTIVVGNSDLVIHNKFTMHHHFYEFDSDYTSEELHDRALINPTKLKIIWYQDTQYRRRIEAGISLLGSCAQNYAHWITETLPKLVAVNELEEFRNIPVLIDSGHVENIRESLRAVDNFDRNVIELRPHEAVFVENLVLVEPSGYVPFRPRLESDASERHGFFNPLAFERLNEILANNYSKSSRVDGALVFLKRNSSYRMVVNQQEIEDALVEKGFIVVEPEKLSFMEQYQLISGAKVVVSATGAACANLVFAGCDARIIILIADNPLMPYFYWQSMAHAVGNRVIYVLGETVGASQGTIHGDYRIEVSDLLDAVADEATKFSQKRSSSSLN